ncbi:hypothetical protein [Cyanobacterium aponinum]|uniref:Uncharacterized protein n=1 Tax=Cyanobacterium aponinum (strain PCC 10605) TaxID=755178 RepID=K9Z7G3_CYAAP|nr:hypothetical protein [Cyanobacterium aponinum]AFZ55084.1 hypothetical protein Cyan10605_3025 [Cyanobacterium aponinum PCC 10605]
MSSIKILKAKNKDANYYRKKIGIKKKDPEKLKKLFDSLNKDLEEMAKSSNMTVEELVNILDPSNPFSF